MKTPKSKLLQRLGAGESIKSVCDATGMSQKQFDDWWHNEIRSRLPIMNGKHIQDVQNTVEIKRDSWGIPHISGECDEDLFFGYGYAMAQDRLFQLDYLRRKGLGRLSEILGKEGLESDLLARTLDFPSIAVEEEKTLPNIILIVLESFVSENCNFLNSSQKQTITPTRRRKETSMATESGACCIRRSPEEP